MQSTLLQKQIIYLSHNDDKLDTRTFVTFDHLQCGASGELLTPVETRNLPFQRQIMHVKFHDHMSRFVRNADNENVNLKPSFNNDG